MIILLIILWIVFIYYLYQAIKGIPVYYRVVSNNIEVGIKVIYMITLGGLCKQIIKIKGLPKVIICNYLRTGAWGIKFGRYEFFGTCSEVDKKYHELLDNKLKEVKTKLKEVKTKIKDIKAKIKDK